MYWPLKVKPAPRGQKAIWALQGLKVQKVKPGHKALPGLKALPVRKAFRGFKGLKALPDRQGRCLGPRWSGACHPPHLS